MGGPSMDALLLAWLWPVAVEGLARVLLLQAEQQLPQAGGLPLAAIMSAVLGSSGGDLHMLCV